MRKKSIQFNNFKYRKEPPYQWSIEYFQNQGITEWDSFCEECMGTYAKESIKVWKKSKL